MRSPLPFLLAGLLVAFAPPVALVEWMLNASREAGRGAAESRGAPALARGSLRAALGTRTGEDRSWDDAAPPPADARGAPQDAARLRLAARGAGALPPAPLDPWGDHTNVHPGREQFHHDARDLAVLRDLIEANGLRESSSGADPDDGDGALEPLELGHQVWRRGRLVSLGLGPGPDFSYGYGVRVLPESLGDLDALRVLALGWNQLESLPDSLGHLQRLEELRLHDNRLESLPDSIGRLSRLRSLWLGRNQLRELPAAVGDLGGLAVLHVDRNPLHALPHAIGTARDLEVLNLGRTPERRAGLRDLPRSIEDLYRLETLYVGGNALGCVGSLPPALVDGSIPRVYGLAHQRCAEAGPEPASQISKPLP